MVYQLSFGVKFDSVFTSTGLIIWKPADSR